MAMSLPIEKLFHHNRFRDAPSLFFILLLLYFPIGIVLMVLRILISFQFLVVLAVLPKGKGTNIYQINIPNKIE